MLGRKHLCVGAVPSGPTCDHVTAFHRCPEHPEVVRVYTDGCNTAECPVCWSVLWLRFNERRRPRWPFFPCASSWVLDQSRPSVWFSRVGSALVFCWLFFYHLVYSGRTEIFMKRGALVSVFGALLQDYDLNLYMLQTNGSLRVFLLVWDTSIEKRT